MEYPTQKRLQAYAEYLITGAAPANVTFDPIVWPVWSPGSLGFRPDANGWIDVRGFTFMTLVGSATDQAANFLVEGKRASNDPENVSVVADTAVTAASTTELFSADISKYAMIRVSVRYQTTPGTYTASILLK